jgi:mediator of RNA polymerase II transcription subunit 15
LKDAGPTGSINNPLYDAISSNLQNPLANHTIQRTFKPTIEAWFGPDIKNLPPAKKRRLSSEEQTQSNSNEIPHLLQGEIARLDSKFKISLDQTAHSTGSKSIKLVCCLEDKFLPCVPPINITIPEGYPMMSPQCNIMEHNTPFLESVEKSLKARISKLPERFSLTHVLETWTLAIRQAYNASSFVEPTQTSVMLAV